MATPKIAIVADWLTNYGGAERVVMTLHEAFPSAPIYSSVYEPDKNLAQVMDGLDIRTTWIQRFPKFLRRFHKWFPVIRVWAFRALDLDEFDVIVVSSIAESKHIRKTRPDQVVICYCHTPVRYYWSHYDEYKKDPGFGKLNWLVRILIPIFMPHQRKLDYKAAQNIDVMIANSTEVQKRIKKYYDRTSTIIYPPIDIKRFDPARTRDDYYVTVGRQVPYKRIDLAVAAATKLGVKLRVFGDGSQHQQLLEIAGPTVEFHTDRMTSASDKAVNEALNHAKGFIFTATDEDFGIVQAEALAAGAPVIALGRGGALDIVEDGVSGVFYEKQTVDSVVEAIKKAETKTFLPATLRRKATRFDKGLFITKIQKIVSDHTNK